MPLFQIREKRLVPIGQSNFKAERDLQRLVEESLGPVFSCRFVASEFSTGARHAGRIDTLALSEEDNPVIIEYKKTESSDLINQSLFYLSWIQDHRGDFEVAAQKQIGSDIKADWSAIRVICIAPNYRRYDLHAVEVMGADIELWTYRRFDNSTVYFEEVYQKAYPVSRSAGPSVKNPTMVEAGKKAAITRSTASYKFEQHIEGKPEKIVSLVQSIREFILGLDSSMEEVPKKYYVAYKISQNIVCVDIKSRHIFLYLKLDPKQYKNLPDNARDVTDIGHYGTGDFELKIRSTGEFELAKSLIEKAYQKIGG